MNRDGGDRWGYRGSAWRPQVPVDTVNESRKRSLVLGAHGPVDVFDPGAAATVPSRPAGRESGRRGGGGVNGIAVGIGPEAVVIQSERPLLAVSSAPIGGGVARVRAVINLHVRKNDPCLDPAAMMTAFARRAGVPAPYVGLLTGAWTEAAQQGAAARYGIEAMAVATVGLSNRMAAGLLAGAVPCRAIHHQRRGGGRCRGGPRCSGERGDHRHRGQGALARRARRFGMAGGSR